MRAGCCPTRPAEGPSSARDGRRIPPADGRSQMAYPSVVSREKWQGGPEVYATASVCDAISPRPSANSRRRRRSGDAAVAVSKRLSRLARWQETADSLVRRHLVGKSALGSRRRGRDGEDHFTRQRRLWRLCLSCRGDSAQCGGGSKGQRESFHEFLLWTRTTRRLDHVHIGRSSPASAWCRCNRMDRCTSNRYGRPRPVCCHGKQVE